MTRDAPSSQAKTTAYAQDRVDAYFQTEAETWEQIYGRSDVSSVVFQDRQRIALKFMDETDLAPDSVVLEVGCGAGFLTLALLERGYEVRAIDSVDPMIARTQRRAAEAGMQDRLRVATADVHRLPFESESFGAVASLGVIPWLRDPVRALAEIARVLKPRGWLVVTTDNGARLTHLVDPFHYPILKPLKQAVKRTLERKGLRQPRIGARQYRLAEFDRLLLGAGFEKVTGVTCGFGAFTLFRQRVVPNRFGLALHRKLQELAERGTPFIRSAGGHYVVLARKAGRVDEPPMHSASGAKAADVVEDGTRIRQVVAVEDIPGTRRPQQLA
jgi:ubiquinone/menaquinone biosynthesis C-methylase UbiE